MSDLKTNRADFLGVFPQILDDLKNYVTENYKGIPENALQWFEENLNTNTVGGKLNRGISVVDSGAVLLGRPLNPQEFKELSTLGWCIELLQSFFLVADDIMDNSMTRRGEPCWYRRPEVQMIAINDAVMLEAALFTVLKQNFRSHPAYVDLIELFHEVIFKTEFGQMCDLITAPQEEVDLSKFSLDKVNFIYIYKTAYYSFFLPIASALHYLQLATPDNLRQAEEILVPLGQYFQAQDDFLDVYGTPDQLGKVGTDIQDNKCSWVVNQALLRASPEQREILDNSYGRKDPELEARCREVFAQLETEQYYHEWEDAQVEELSRKIEAVDESQGLKKQIFGDFLKKIHKRQK